MKHNKPPDARVSIPWPSPKDPFPGANEMENDARTHWSKGHKLRKKWKDWFIIHMTKLPKNKFKRVWLRIIYYEKTMTGPHARDPDNVAAVKKILLDALVTAEVIPNDKHENIAGWHEWFSQGVNGGIDLAIYDHTDEEDQDGIV